MLYMVDKRRTEAMSEDTHSLLQQIKSELSLKDKKDYSYDDVFKILIEVYKHESTH